MTKTKTKTKEKDRDKTKDKRRRHNQIPKTKDKRQKQNAKDNDKRQNKRQNKTKGLFFGLHSVTRNFVYLTFFFFSLMMIVIVQTKRRTKRNMPVEVCGWKKMTAFGLLKIFKSLHWDKRMTLEHVRETQYFLSFCHKLQKDYRNVELFFDNFYLPVYRFLYMFFTRYLLEKQMHKLRPACSFLSVFLSVLSVLLLSSD